MGPDVPYYKCVTFRPLNVDRENIFSSKLLLYVDTTDSVYDVVFISSDGYSEQGAGLRVLVHAPGTAPDMTFGINIGPGTATTIQLTQSVRTRLGHPYTNCTDKPYLSWDNTSDVYTRQYCVNTCVQQNIVDHCRCVSDLVPQYTMAQLRQVDFQLCRDSFEDYA